MNPLPFRDPVSEDFSRKRRIKSSEVAERIEFGPVVLVRVRVGVGVECGEDRSGDVGFGREVKVGRERSGSGSAD